MATNKIYLVEWSDYDDHAVEGAFTNEGAANLIAFMLNERKRNHSRDKRVRVNDYSVEPYPLFESADDFLESEKNGD
jgi:hypothetical protein